MSATVTVLGASILALLLAGYLGQHYLPPPKPRIVGIDLGTTYSCIAVYHAVTGEVQVIELDNHDTIPSMVAFTPEGTELVGYSALCQAEQNVVNTIYDAKRFIGKRFTPEKLKEEASRYSFKVKLQVDNDLATFEVNSQVVSPEYIGSRIILHLKEKGERQLGVTVDKVVISVPADFDELQRNYTRAAAQLAGLEVLRIINEPTAAAMAYGLHNQRTPSEIIVVDMGGGTLDVSLLRVHGGMFQTLAMAGNNHLGGQDINHRLVQYLCDLIAMKYSKPVLNVRELQNLRLAVEDVKLNLTNHESSLLQLPLPSLGDHVIFTENITREMFEHLNEDLFQKVLEPIRLVIEEVEMTPDDIDEVVLVGGSTRIPRVRQVVGDFFGKVPNVEVDPELAVVYGVAIQAGIIGGMWPLQVSAIEIHNTKVKKIRVT
ncbi:heat shock 70 kDa protein 13-like isoform X2 [Acanthaster planci]|uniref:Heat shock 70 kDa protein 13 n=1 Tax=Acanthaster planci TaxID=133434 RepID=A0A8B7YT40_ACAPL|nr:heat shock 70 kDa protein 13-like isoform X2 [Acanthaster planci]